MKFMGQKGGKDHLLAAVVAGSESSRFVYRGQTPMPVWGYCPHRCRGSLSNNGFLLPGFYLQPGSWWSSGGCLTSLLCAVTCRHPMSELHPFEIPRKVLVTESYMILLYSVQFLCIVRFAEVVLF